MRLFSLPFSVQTTQFRPCCHRVLRLKAPAASPSLRGACPAPKPWCFSGCWKMTSTARTPRHAALPPPPPAPTSPRKAERPEHGAARSRGAAAGRGAARRKPQQTWPLPNCLSGEKKKKKLKVNIKSSPYGTDMFELCRLNKKKKFKEKNGRVSGGVRAVVRQHKAEEVGLQGLAGPRPGSA